MNLRTRLGKLEGTAGREPATCTACGQNPTTGAVAIYAPEEPQPSGCVVCGLPLIFIPDNGREPKVAA